MEVVDSGSEVDAGKSFQHGLHIRFRLLTLYNDIENKGQLG